jgi:dipeptidase E
MRLLLLSNSRNPGAGFLAHALPEIGSFFGTARRRLLFFPYAAVRLPLDDYAAKVRSAFRRLGHEVISAHRVPLARAIRKAEGFIVGGGNTFHLLQLMQQRGALEAVARRVKAGVPYMGWSAGANLACPTIRTTNDMPVVEPDSLGAMGLVPFQLNPHYTDRVLGRHGGETRDERIAEFLALNPRVPALGLREGSLLRREGSELRLLLGPGARLFRHGRRRRDYGAGADLSFLV